MFVTEDELTKLLEENIALMTSEALDYIIALAEVELRERHTDEASIHS
jgi:hypothetical protein